MNHNERRRTVLDLLRQLQGQYQYVYVRKWTNPGSPEFAWGAWVAEDHPTIEGEYNILGFCSGATQLEAMIGLARGLQQSAITD